MAGGEMKTLTALFVFSILTLSVSGTIILKYKDVEIDLRKFPDEAGFTFTIVKGNDTIYMGVIGKTFDERFDLTTANNMAVLGFPEYNIMLKVTVEIFDKNWRVNLRWVSPVDKRLMDCFLLEPYDWYGGPEQKDQYWPVQKLTFKDYSYVTKEEQNAGITEPYWINSAGTFYYIHKEVPLFIDQNNLMDKHICFVADAKEPYSKNRAFNELNYDIVFNDGAADGHRYAVREYLGKPSGIPDPRLVQYPLWSTWARYSRPINQTTVFQFATEIIGHGFSNHSQVGIDDLWEICYGSLTVDTRKFPSMKKLIDDLREMGLRVIMWVHPFINENCEPWYTEAKDKGYLIKTENGSVYTSWWNNNGTKASHIDFTNPMAKLWWMQRILALQEEFGVDSFKFDAGESGWTPQVPLQRGDIHLHPSILTREYVQAVAEFGTMIEIRTGQRTQHLPVFIRMVDKNSQWAERNGLPTLVTTLLQMNMNGYPFVLPDMIGGNGANLDEQDTPPTKELFIRWLQANSLMPAMQYSFVPWQFDKETIDIAVKYTDLHYKYSNVIIQLMERAVSEGLPVNPPVWWNDPDDLIALGIYDEYLLGDDILVAPVLKEGAVMRDIYLPSGFWVDGEDDRYIYRGGSWFRNFSAPLEKLPYFIRVTVANEDEHDIIEGDSYYS